ncbi:hypothetical protein [Pseudarthrobacter oxydans]|uniref:hypothetical protein n=1 Tax=Pseudarthrobacter oxydans TaxID=1671 RepID=UPI00344E7C9F
MPQESQEIFGPTEETLAVLLEVAVDGNSPGSRIALEAARRGSLWDAIDLLWAASAIHTPDDDTADSLAMAGAMAANYARYDPRPGWLGEVSNDTQFLDRLRNELEEWSSPGAAARPDTTAQQEAFGDALTGPIGSGFGLVRKWLPNLANAAARKAGHIILNSHRKDLHRQLARFCGDVFVYLNSRGTTAQPGEIVTRILNDLDEADEIRRQQGAEDPKLYVIGHSMGGVILYDILTHFRPNLHIDALVTVGSQIAVFEEMKLFLENGPNMPIIPQIDRIARPDNIGCWINVFDQQDILGFATEGIFSGTRDFAFSTGKPLWMAHSSYFSQLSFHERLSDRLGSVCQ